MCSICRTCPYQCGRAHWRFSISLLPSEVFPAPDPSYTAQSYKRLDPWDPCDLWQPRIVLPPKFRVFRSIYSVKICETASFGASPSASLFLFQWMRCGLQILLHIPSYHFILWSCPDLIAMMIQSSWLHIYIFIIYLKIYIYISDYIWLRFIGNSILVTILLIRRRGFFGDPSTSLKNRRHLCWIPWNSIISPDRVSDPSAAGPPMTSQPMGKITMGNSPWMFHG